MDCLSAQQTLTAAADREPVDSELLAEARSHCATCPECSQFVRAQIAAAKAGLPEPPPDLADRAMAAVRAEAAVQAASRARDAETRTVAATGEAAPGVGAAVGASGTLGGADSGPESAPLASQPKGAAGESASDPAPVRPVRRLSPGTTILAFGAVVTAAAIGVAIVGSRYLSSTPVTESRTSSTGQLAASPGAGAAPEAAPSTGGSAASSSAPADSTALGAPDFLSFGGGVYRSQGEASVDFATLRDAGLITLTATGTPTQRSIKTGADPDLVYLTNPLGGLVAFKRVKREFDGQTYYLTSADITSLATWPTLPPSIAPPTSPDGYPTFVASGADSSGVRVYRLATAPTSGGIAVAPGTPEGDPAAGNPNWTYWQPNR